LQESTEVVEHLGFTGTDRVARSCGERTTARVVRVVHTGSHDAVFGPSPDGGYWLVGLKRRPRIPRAFKSITWSSHDALEQTIANLSGLRVARVATLPGAGEAENPASSQGGVGRIVLPPGS